MLAASLLALLSGAGLGATDYFGGRQSARWGTLRVLVVSQACGLLVLATLGLVMSIPIPNASTLAFGGAAGVCEIVGTAALYRGLSRGRASVVAPAAALAPIIPAATEILTGKDLSVPFIAGGIAAVLGIVLVAAQERGTHGKSGGIGWGLLAAAGFGGYLVFIARATETGDPISALAVDRAIALTLASIAFVIFYARNRSIENIPSGRFAAVGALGVAIAAADIAYATATTFGSLTLAAVLSSTHPVFTVLFAKVFGAQEVGARRWPGIAIGATIIAATSGP